jgi:hypothetical protein
MIHVTALKHVADYTLRLCFTTDEWREINLEPHLWGPVFEPLKDPALFAQVRVDEEAQTIVWPNGADFAPAFLYDNSHPVNHAVA